MRFWIFITIGVYLGLFIALLFAYKAENQDLYCPHPGADVCTYGNGAAYAQGIPNENDTLSELLAKLKIASRYDKNSVTWRRCLIFSIIAGLIVSFLILRRLPTGSELLSAVFTIYLLLYLMYEFYKRELSLPAVTHVDNIVHIINDKLETPVVELPETKKKTKSKRKRKGRSQKLTI